MTGLKVIFDNTVYCVRYQDPTYTAGYKFPAKTLEGAILPPKILKPQDFNERQPWRPQIGKLFINLPIFFYQCTNIIKI